MEGGKHEQSQWLPSMYITDMEGRKKDKKDQRKKTTRKEKRLKKENFDKKKLLGTMNTS